MKNSNLEQGKKTEVISISIPKKLSEKIKRLKQESGVTISGLIRISLERWFKYERRKK